MRVKDGEGSVVADEPLGATVRDASTALDSLAVWFRGRFGNARLAGVGHRVVHGGAQFAGPIVVTPQVMDDLRKLIPLAPLHQPHNLAAIEAVSARLPGVPQVACFDTSFHRGQSEVAQIIPLPKHIREAGVQRYGFHGLSYEYIASVLPEAAPEIAGKRVIVAHLGSGSSLCAMRDGKSVDSTFGFTALDGLCMGTRTGSVDPGAILFLFQNLGLSASEVETILYKKSGLIGISGVSNDMRVLLTSERAGGAAGGGLLRLSRGERDRGADGGAWWTRWTGVHRRYRRELGADPQADLRNVGVARHRARCRRQRRQRSTNLQARQPGIGLGDSHQRRADDCPAHRCPARAGRGTRVTAPASPGRVRVKSVPILAIVLGVMLGGAGHPTAADDVLEIRLMPVRGSAPKDVVIRATVGREDSNRRLEFVVDSTSYYASSTSELDGSRAPKTIDARFRQVPPGDYVIRVILTGTDGERARAVVTFTLL